nr:hypothetical protein [Nocardia brevicatena]
MITHWPSLARLASVWDDASQPGAIVRPSAQDEDIGSMFTDPSGLIVVINAIGVPT